MKHGFNLKMTKKKKIDNHYSSPPPPNSDSVAIVSEMKLKLEEN